MKLHFNTFPDAHLVPDEVILCNMGKIVLSPVWFDFIKDKMTISDVVEMQLHHSVQRLLIKCMFTELIYYVFYMNKSNQQ